MRVKVRPMPPRPCQTPDLPHWHLPLQVQQVAPSLAPVSQPAGGISGGPSPNAGTQVPDEILAFLISANFYADDWAVAAAAVEAAGENSDRSQAPKRQKAGPK